MRRLIWLGIVLAIISGAAVAQDAVEPLVVQVEAADGLALAGDYYALAVEPDAPVILLMHMLGSVRGAWSPLIPALLEAGYPVVNVDLRGHGATGGRTDWDAATIDVQTWIDWLHTQPDMENSPVVVIGASIGSNLALIGCARDSACPTAVALSPGIDYQGVQPLDSVVEGMSERAVLLVASQADQYSADSIREMVSLAAGDIGLRIYTGNAHGTNLFRNKLESVTALIVGWLAEHAPTE